MNQRWGKLGLIFCPSKQQEWLHSHASVPIAESLGGNDFKIYFSSRNKSNQSFTGYVVIDITRPHQILDLSLKPTLCPGELGAFDDSGAMATWLTHYNDTRFLYYIGWNLGVTVPFRNSIGLSVSKNGQPFKKYSVGPILDRSLREPHFVASCCVIPGDDKWRMWYLSCTGWTMRNNLPEHRYHIKYAESEDGITWTRDGSIAINYTNDAEHAISRPSVIKDVDCWKMWYSYRGERYRIGYAESVDGMNWIRHDQSVCIDTSSNGWDSKMVEYPFVFNHDGSRYMLYNGNSYGKTGFGLAILENF